MYSPSALPSRLLTEPDSGRFETDTYLLKPHPGSRSSANQGWAERSPIEPGACCPSGICSSTPVEARKNLFLLAEAFESNLSAQGIHLCVTGKLKNDDYSAAVR